MACYIFRSIAFCFILLGSGSLLHAEDTTEYSDKSGAFSVRAGADWKRLPNKEATNKTLTLVLECSTGSAGKQYPVFGCGIIHQSADGVNLDHLAQRLLDIDRKKVVDQGKYGEIATAKLDGEDARVITVKSIVKGVPTIHQVMLAIHNGKVFEVIFSSDDENFEKLSTERDALFASFHWK